MFFAFSPKLLHFRSAIRSSCKKHHDKKTGKKFLEFFIDFDTRHFCPASKGVGGGMKKSQLFFCVKVSNLRLEAF